MAEEATAEQQHSDLDMRFFRFHNRITRLEKKLNSFDDRIQMLESDMTEKHRETMERLKEATVAISSFKNELVQARDFVERVNKRLSEFASKESVKTLEKYIKLWDPLKYVSVPEVKKMINDALGVEAPES